MKESSTLARVDSDRLWADLMKIAEFTEPGKPYTRRCFSPLFEQARSWLKQRFTDCGIVVRIDSAGNLIGRLDGTSSGAGTIMMGSHCDTVAGGGRFDGVAGVIAGLEIARTLKEQGFKPRHNIEFVDFLAEEMNVFGLSCVGSRGMSGYLDEKMLAYSSPDGETLGEAIAKVGGNCQRIEEAKRPDIRAFFELHIEQGPILENECHDIGLVTGIVGIRRIEILFRGEADHAGTMPMHLRKDAASALAETMVLVRKLAEGIALLKEGHFVATVGVVELQPNAANVVPESARMIIDVRSENRELLDKFTAALETVTTATAAVMRVQRETFTILSDSMSSNLNDDLRHLLGDCARDMRLSTRELASGAGHDTGFIAKIAPAAMVFVPCRKGKSHSSEEWAEPDMLAEGANVVAEAIVRFDSR